MCRKIKWPIPYALFVKWVGIFLRHRVNAIYSQCYKAKKSLESLIPAEINTDDHTFSRQIMAMFRLEFENQAAMSELFSSSLLS